MNRRLLIALQTLVSVGLLGWIFWNPAFRAQAWEVLTSARPAWLAAGFLVAGAGNLLAVVRWKIFLRLLGLNVAPWDVLRMSFVGLLLNSFLVGGAGGDAVKVVWLAARGRSRSRALLSVVMDRVSGLGALILCSLVFILWRLEWLMQTPVVAGVIRFVFAFLGIIVALIAFSFVIAARGWTSRLPEKLPGRAQIIEFTRTYFQFVSSWRQTLLASLISVLMLIAHFLMFYCSARAFNVHVPMADFLAIMPAVDVISALPVSLGGLGVREQLFSTLLGDLSGVPAAQAVSVSLGGAFLSTVWGALGLALLPSYREATRGMARI